MLRVSGGEGREPISVWPTPTYIQFVTKWKEVSLDIVAEAPTVSTRENSISNVINWATRIVAYHIKTMTVAQRAKLYWRHVGRLYSVP